MVVLYLRELALKLVKRTETFAVLIAFSLVDNPAAFWLPANDSDDDAAVVPESAVKFAHNCFALR